jgi:hypothetical protein
MKANDSNGVPSKAPEGFRVFTFEEEREYLAMSSNIQILHEKLARHNAEVELAKMMVKDTTRNLALAHQQMQGFHKKLGIVKADDLTDFDGKLCTRVQTSDK